VLKTVFFGSFPFNQLSQSARLFWVLPGPLKLNWKRILSFILEKTVFVLFDVQQSKMFWKLTYSESWNVIWETMNYQAHFPEKENG
jgi:hypothetical protein